MSGHGDFELGCDSVYRARLLQELPWLEHGFGTALSDDWPGVMVLTTAKQIHSDRVLMADGLSGLIGEGDALIARRPGTTVAVRTADCLPILIADRRTHTVAAVHAGWRGTVAGITAKTVQAFADRFGSRVDDLGVAIGPGIGKCCFGVGPEVAVLFRDLFPERDDLEQRTRIDLVEANIRQMCRIGVKKGQIVASGGCTCCGGERFHSFRRDQEKSGRMVSLVGVRTA